MEKPDGSLAPDRRSDASGGVHSVSSGAKECNDATSALPKPALPRSEPSEFSALRSAGGSSLYHAVLPDSGATLCASERWRGVSSADCAYVCLLVACWRPYSHDRRASTADVRCNSFGCGLFGFCLAGWTTRIHLRDFARSPPPGHWHHLCCRAAHQCR